MKTNKIISILLLSILTLNTTAQENRNKRYMRFNPKQFHQEIVNFIKEKAEFSEQESEVFFKLYDEMKEKQRKLQHKIKQTEYNKQPVLSEKEAANRIQKILEMEEEMVDLKEEYYKKMLKKLPAVKVYNCILLENAFHRNMIWKMNHKKQHYNDTTR